MSSNFACILPSLDEIPTLEFWPGIPKIRVALGHAENCSLCRKRAAFAFPLPGNWHLIMNVALSFADERTGEMLSMLILFKLNENKASDPDWKSPLFWEVVSKSVWQNESAQGDENCNSILRRPAWKCKKKHLLFAKKIGTIFSANVSCISTQKIMHGGPRVTWRERKK